MLRKADKINNLLQFHSDIRSDKINILKNNNKATFIFYDKEEKIQARIKVETKINHENDVTMSVSKHVNTKVDTNEARNNSPMDFEDNSSVLETNLSFDDSVQSFTHSNGANGPVFVDNSPERENGITRIVIHAPPPNPILPKAFLFLSMNCWTMSKGSLPLAILERGVNAS